MADGIKISEMQELTTLKNNTLIPVVDNGVNKAVKFENMNTYTNDYQIIGKWIDGSNIYRKIFTSWSWFTYDDTNKGSSACNLNKHCKYILDTKILVFNYNGHADNWFIINDYIATSANYSQITFNNIERDLSNYNVKIIVEFVEGEI